MEDASVTPPAYNKPDKPGIWMGFDNTVAIYHIIGDDDSFEDASLDVFGLLKLAQERHPDWPRVIYLDIPGHKGEREGFSDDFFEFQQEFMIGLLGPYFTAVDLPLVSVFNPNPQRNDLPDKLDIQA